VFVAFFIQRPIFAVVCSILVVLAGAICIPGLPISQYPQIALPQVVVTSIYTGANSEVVEDSVTIPLEQAINGVDGMKYMTSVSSNDGSSTITVTFDASHSIDIAAVDVQNRVSTAQARLPSEVKQTGVTITKNASNFVLAFTLTADKGLYDQQFLSNYADVNLKDALKRVKGVGDVQTASRPSMCAPRAEWVAATSAPAGCRSNRAVSAPWPPGRWSAWATSCARTRAPLRASSVTTTCFVRRRSTARPRSARARARA